MFVKVFHVHMQHLRFYTISRDQRDSDLFLGEEKKTLLIRRTDSSHSMGTASSICWQCSHAWHPAERPKAGDKPTTTPNAVKSVAYIIDFFFFFFFPEEISDVIQDGLSCNTITGASNASFIYILTTDDYAVLLLLYNQSIKKASQFEPVYFVSP